MNFLWIPPFLASYNCKHSYIVNVSILPTLDFIECDFVFKKNPLYPPESRTET